MKKIKFCFLLCFIFALYFHSTIWAKYEMNKTFVAATLQIDQENATTKTLSETKELENLVNITTNTL